MNIVQLVWHMLLNLSINDDSLEWRKEVNAVVTFPCRDYTIVVK